METLEKRDRLPSMETPGKMEKRDEVKLPELESKASTLVTHLNCDSFVKERQKPPKSPVISSSLRFISINLNAEIQAQTGKENLVDGKLLGILILFLFILVSAYQLRFLFRW